MIFSHIFLKVHYLFIRKILFRDRRHMTTNLSSRPFNGCPGIGLVLVEHLDLYSQLHKMGLKNSFICHFTTPVKDYVVRCLNFPATSENHLAFYSYLHLCLTI
jgi:hypothetical protein